LQDVSQGYELLKESADESESYCSHTTVLRGVLA